MQRWRHWWHEIFVGTAFRDLGSGRYAANRTCGVANELTGAIHRERYPNAFGAVPAVSGDTFFKAWRDHA